MRITSKPTVDRQALGRAQKKMDAARQFAAKEMAELRAQRKASGAKPGEGRVAGWHRDAVFNAIAKYGPEVMTSAASGFWDDQKRSYPEMCADDRVPGTDSVNGHKCRMGKVSEKFIHGKWWHWDPVVSDWVEGQVTKKRGVR